MNSTELERLYLEEKKCAREIAEMFGWSISTIRRALLSAGVQMRSAREATTMSRAAIQEKYRGKPRIDPAMRARLNEGKRARAESLGAGTRINSKGYVEICGHSSDCGRSEHVLVMERHIGRKLAPNEVVHHKDRDRKNNNLENLQLMTRSTHAALHRAEDKRKKK